MYCLETSFQSPYVFDVLLIWEDSEEENMEKVTTKDAEAVLKKWEGEKLFSGIKSTKIPRFELIPKSSLEALALIFEKGIERKGDGAWNALTLSREEALKTKEFVIERLSHVIKHSYDAIRKVMDGTEWEGEEDAGAIMFGGAVLAEYKRFRKESVSLSESYKL
jgi:hypothetical protein